MPIESANIKMSDINAEVSSVNSTSLNTLSTNAITAGNTIDGAAPHGMNEFAGYVHTNLESFPSINSWDTRQNRTVSAGGYTQAEAFCSMAFKNDTSNSRIECTWYGGTNAAFATIYTDYMDYSGYTGDINVSYTYPDMNGSPLASNPLVYAGSSTSYPPYGWPGHASNTATTSTAYAGPSYRKVRNTNYKIPTAGYAQFKWFLRTNATQYQNQFRSCFHHQVTFTVSFVSDSVTYSKTSSSKNIELECWKGQIY